MTSRLCVRSPAIVHYQPMEREVPFAAFPCSSELGALMSVPFRISTACRGIEEREIIHGRIDGNLKGK